MAPVRPRHSSCPFCLSPRSSSTESSATLAEYECADCGKRWSELIEPLRDIPKRAPAPMAPMCPQCHQAENLIRERVVTRDVVQDVLRCPRCNVAWVPRKPGDRSA